MLVALVRAVTTAIILPCGLLATALPAWAHDAPQAQLIHCSQETCLQISGRRGRATDAIRIAGREFAVEGGRKWHVTVPLQVARAWGTPSGDTLVLALIDTQSGAERQEEVALPPGALGRRVELATLLVSAR